MKGLKTDLMFSLKGFFLHLTSLRLERPCLLRQGSAALELSCYLILHSRSDQSFYLFILLASGHVTLWSCDAGSHLEGHFCEMLEYIGQILATFK